MKSRQETAAKEKHKVHFSGRKMYFMYTIAFIVLTILALFVVHFFYQKQLDSISCKQVLSKAGNSTKLSQVQQYELLKKYFKKCTVDNHAWQEGNIKDNQLIYAARYVRIAQHLNHNKEASSIAKKAYDTYQEDIPYDNIDDIPSSVLNAIAELRYAQDSYSNV